MAGCVGMLSAVAGDGLAADPSGVGCIQQGKIPEVKMPAEQGERYEDTVPDTIDIAESARLASNVLTGSLDANMDYELYCAGNFGPTRR